MLGCKHLPNNFDFIGYFKIFKGKISPKTFELLSENPEKFQNFTELNISIELNN